MSSVVSSPAATPRSISPPAPAPASRAKRRPLRRFLPWLLGAGLIALAAWSLRPQPLEVETAAVSSGPLTVSVLEEGKTRIRHRYLITAPVGGLLRRVEYRAGARIKAGKTVLALLEPEPSSFLNPRAKAEAEARLQAAEASRMQREVEVQRARDALDLAGREFDRARILKQSGAIATREWDSAENQVALLTKGVNTAEFALRVARFGEEQARAALLQAQTPPGDPGAGAPDSGSPPAPDRETADHSAPAEGGSASPASGVFRILSPVDGFILNVMEENARIVAPGAQIMEVGDPADLEAEIELLSSDAVGVRPGADVSIEQWGGSAPLRGRVTLVEPGGYTKISALGVEEQRVKVRVDFTDLPPPDRFLGDRYRVEARIVTWHSDSVLQLPAGALFRRGGDWMTFVVENGHARRRKVDILHNNGTAAEITGGLTAGETVILHPPDTLEEGGKVKPRDQK